MTAMHAERVFKTLLRLYPQAFRERYGEEMAQVFRLQFETQGSSFLFWVRIVWDMISSASRERLKGGPMRTQNAISLVGGSAAIAYGLVLPALVVLLSPLRTGPIVPTDMWKYSLLEVIVTVAIPGIAIICSLGGLERPLTWVQRFGGVLSVAALVTSRWLEIQSLIPFLNSLPDSSFWLDVFSTFALPAGLLLMAIVRGWTEGAQSLKAVPSMFIVLAATQLLLGLVFFFGMRSLSSYDADRYFLLLLAMNQLPWAGLGWALLHHRKSSLNRPGMA